MRVRITDDCISCSPFVEVCPEVFEMGESLAQVKVNRVPEGVRGRGAAAGR